MAVRKPRLRFGYLGKENAIKGFKFHACCMNGYTKKHNGLLHSEKQMHESKNPTNVSAATIRQKNQVTSFLQIVLVSIQCGRYRMKTYAFSILKQHYHSAIKALSSMSINVMFLEQRVHQPVPTTL